MRTFARYVAIGDSSTEGLEDPDGFGGYRGWADRLAARLAEVQGVVHYANLGIRGRRTRQILEEQLPRAAAMRPDLTTIFSGTNDVIARRFDLPGLRHDLEVIQGTLIEGGTTVLTFTLPDLTPVMPLARGLVPRVEALNRAIREVSTATGAIVVDVAAHPVASDPRLWNADRLHANSAGHARIAAALAHGLGLPGSDDSWSHDLPAMPPRHLLSRLGGELAWIAGHLVPWVWKHAHGRSSGDGRAPKRPELVELRHPRS